MTAAVLRVLVASGVCGAFALWYLLSNTRFAQRLDFQALARAYPWLGAPLELLRAQGREGTSLLCAHAVRVVVAYASVRGRRNTPSQGGSMDHLYLDH